MGQPYNMASDAGPTNATGPCMDPVSRLRHLDCVATNTAADVSPELAYGQSAPSTPSISKREHCVSETGSPIRVQSPLRHSISYIERPDLPFPFPNQDPVTIDPTKSPTGSTERMALTGDARKRGVQPARLGSATSSDATSTRSRTSSQGTLKETLSSPGTASSTPTSASRFSFFSTAFKGLTSSPAAARPDASDDLISLNIEQTLHSMTSPTDRSTFSPAAFKNLQMVATGLLHKFQDAYTQRTIELRELKAEQAVQADEQSEVETKMQHLRMQLEGMAKKAAEQEEMMQALMAELSREKKLRMDQAQLLSRGSSVEDLGVEEDQMRKWRKSSNTSRSDTSFDSDEEGTEEASVFSSRSRSPTIATVVSEASPTEATLPLPLQLSPVSSKTAALVAPPRTSRPQQNQMTAFQKLFKGLSVEGRDGEAPVPNSCSNCHGQDAGMAWDTVNLLKDENKGLKQRVGDLEDALEGALDVVNGVGL